MIKKLLTYSVGEVLVKGISFLAVPLYSHLILPHEYGILGFLNALVSFLPFIFTLYYLYAYVRFSVDTPDEVLLSTYFYMGIFLNLFYLSGALILYNVVIKYYDIAFKYFFLSILGSSLIFMFQILQMHYRSKGLAKNYIKNSIFYTLFGLSLNFIFLMLFNDNVLAMLLSSMLTALAVSLVAFWLLRTYISWTKYDIVLMKRILSYSTPLVPGAIALLLFSQSDKLILVGYATKEELGIYTFAFTLGLVMSYIGSAFFIGYQPIFYEKIASQEYDDIIQQFKKNVFLIICALLLSWVGIWVAYQFVDLKYRAGLPISLMIALAYGFVTFAQMMELHLTYKKKTGMVSLVYGIGGVVTVVFLYIFIPLFGVEGASYSLFLGAMIISSLMYIMAQRHLYVDYNKTILILLYLIFCILGIVIL